MEAALRLLVTGGAGFIGSNFVRLMLEQYPDYAIAVLDKLTYAGNLENLPDWKPIRVTTSSRATSATRNRLAAILKRGIDAVVNFAAESHVDRSILDASEFVRTKSSGTLNLLDACAARHGVPVSCRFPPTRSTAAWARRALFTETTPIAPNSPYAASKAAADLLVRSYYHTYGFPA